MNRRRFGSWGIAILLSVSLLATAASSALADPRDFNLSNNSSANLVNVYLAPTSVDDWAAEDDQLGGQTIPAGATVPVTFNGQGSTCVYDIRVVDDSGNAGEIDGLDLCNTTTVTYSG